MSNVRDHGQSLQVELIVVILYMRLHLAFYSKGATTLSIMTINIDGLYVTLSIIDSDHQ
jgi:hypothetical protein